MLSLPIGTFVRICEDDSVPPLLRGQYAEVVGERFHAEARQGQIPLRLYAWRGRPVVGIPRGQLDVLPPEMFARLRFLLERVESLDDSKVAVPGGAPDRRLDNAIYVYEEAWDEFEEMVFDGRRSLHPLPGIWEAHGPRAALDAYDPSLCDAVDPVVLERTWARLVAQTSSVAYEARRVVEVA